MGVIGQIPDGFKLVKIDNKTWVQVPNGKEAKEIVKTNYSEDDYKHDKGVQVLYNGLHFNSKKELAAHLGFSQSKLSLHIKKKKITVKILGKKKT